uniref:N-acetyltransferase domain-containing protein n=1 Tax=Strongyloides venezuelensis TaxID=75913 RepID=A0A0K0FXM4_STRVS
MTLSSLLRSPFVRGVKIDSFLKSVVPSGNNVKLRQAEKSDFDDILSCISKRFLLIDPFITSFGLSEKELYPVYEFVATNSIQSGCSIVAYDQNNEKLVGFRLQSIYKRDDPELEQYIKMMPLQCENIKQLVNFTKIIRKGVWKFIPIDINTILYRRLIYIDSNYETNAVVKMISESNFDEVLFSQMELEGALIEAYTKKQYDIVKSWGYETLKQVGINEFGNIVKTEDETNLNSKIKLSYMFKRFH